MSQSFLPQELIRKKRDQKELSAEEISAFFSDFLAGKVSDYQASAMLMAIFLNGMSHQETVAMTKANRDSGVVLDWPYAADTVVDKHSTGGIGDKTSMILLPLCCLEGLKIPMISGRGLGHSGGTLDKLESLPGMNVRPSIDEARKIIDEFGGCFMGQSEEIARLDRRLYALRDVTATVESIPLIVASILSKKLAEGLGALVLDVKFGSGAFMANEKAARALAKDLVTVAKECGLNTVALLTNMNTPLGTNAGNALEMRECFEVMRGEGAADTRALSIELASEMVHLAQPSRNMTEIRATLGEHLDSGRALECFRNIATAQGADPRCIDNPSLLAQAKETVPITAATNGFVSAIDVRALGVAIVKLGGGRQKTADSIDPAVGLSDLAKVGVEVTKGDLLAKIHLNDTSNSDTATELVNQAYSLAKAAPPPQDLILDRITPN